MGADPSGPEYFVSIDGGKFRQFVDIVRQDPAVANGRRFNGRRGTRWRHESGRLFVDLSHSAQRKKPPAGSSRGFARKLAAVPGATVSSHRAGNPSGRETAQLALPIYAASRNLAGPAEWTPRILDALKSEPILQDLNPTRRTRGSKPTW